jgi:hypothetical protein
MFEFFRKLGGGAKRPKYRIAEFHDGMARAYGTGEECGYVNCNKEFVIRLTNEEGRIVFAGMDDINWEDETVKEYSRSISRLTSEYYFGAENFESGVALVTWTVLPDGRYFADEDGFGGEDNDEINIHCFIDKSGKVVIPFQCMTNEQIDEFRKKAEKIVSGRI